MATLVILTNHFPYGIGEQFFEEEIKFWKNTKFNNVYLLPVEKSHKVRAFPHEIKLLSPNKNSKKVSSVLKALTCKKFYKEIFSLKRNFTVLKAFSALKQMALILREVEHLRKELKKINDKEIYIYSYWNDISSYAACILKRKGQVRKVLSRAHRYDLYEEHRVGNYMPYKRNFVKDYDKIYLLSGGALNYYLNKYQAKNEQLAVARLGVKKNNIDFRTPKKLNNKILNLLSISYCVPVKQLDKIMDGILQFSLRRSDLKINWVHIGAGKLFDTLNNQAKQISNDIDNLSIDFLGQISNTEVHHYLKSEEIDIFINGSLSEGIPVSIMEAMSHGIPAIAPDVGEVADLVNSENGVLLSSDYTLEELVAAINQLSDENVRFQKSRKAKEWTDLYFNSEDNYKSFIDEIYNQCVSEK